MSALGYIRLFLLLCSIASLQACVFFFIFRKPRRGTIAGVLVVLAFIGVALLGSTKGKSAREAFVQKATEKIVECRALGETPVIRSERIIISDLATGRTDPAQAEAAGWFEFLRELDPNPTDVPVTVFLVSPQQSKLVGTYSISNQPAYRQWFDVYVVQFRNFNDAGTAVAAHQIQSFDPARERSVTYSPEYGSFSHPAAGEGVQYPLPIQPLPDWIRSLPIQ